MTTNANEFELIESVANTLPPAAREDFRTLMQGWSGQLATLNTSTGNTPAGNTGNIATPPAPAFSVSGANGVFSWKVTPPVLTAQGYLWYEISYSTVKGFTSNVTTLDATTATAGTINLPNASLFFRVRASLNRTVWSAYTLASQSAISSGLVSSGATSNGGAFNQTNFGIVTSQAVGSAAVVEVQGASGSLSSMVAVKGSTEQIQPAAAIVNVPFGTTQFVGYQQSKNAYKLGPTLASVLDDETTPVGAVSVVGSGTPTLPVVTLVVQNGYIVGATWTGDNGLSAIPQFVINDATGSGAKIEGTGVSGGHLQGIRVINSGDGHYSAHPTVIASGGISGGTTGGGTITGGNGGRLTAV
jgi:hypothetical protein